MRQIFQETHLKNICYYLLLHCQKSYTNICSREMLSSMVGLAITQLRHLIDTCP